MAVRAAAASGIILRTMADSPARQSPPDAERSRKDNARRIAIGILGAVALLFAILNFEDVKVDLLFGSVTMPLVIVIAACLLIGGLIGAYLGRRGAKRG